jgi:hypothetical protein
MNGGTNPITNKTLSADEVIGEILDTNNVFIPIAVGPFGEFGSLFHRFIKTHKTLPLPTFSQDRPNATRAAALAVTNRTPYNVLGKADTMETQYGKKHTHVTVPQYMDQSTARTRNCHTLGEPN